MIPIIKYPYEFKRGKDRKKRKSRKKAFLLAGAGAVGIVGLGSTILSNKKKNSSNLAIEKSKEYKSRGRETTKGKTKEEKSRVVKRRKALIQRELNDSARWAEKNDLRSPRKISKSGRVTHTTNLLSPNYKNESGGISSASYVKPAVSKLRRKYGVNYQRDTSDILYFKRGKDKKKRKSRKKKLGFTVAVGGTLAIYGLKKEKDFKTANSLKGVMSQNKSLYTKDVRVARDARNSVGEFNVSKRANNLHPNEVQHLTSSVKRYKNAKSSMKVRRELQSSLNNQYRNLRSFSPFTK